MNKVKAVLYGLFEKDIAFNSSLAEWNGVPVVFSTNWDKNNSPACYIFLRQDVSNIGIAYGDGKVNKRRSDCDIMAVCSGAESDKLSELELELERLLSDISYIKINLGYSDAIKESQTTYAISIEV